METENKEFNLNTKVDTEKSKLTRNELVYMSRLMEKADNYEEMLQCIRLFIKLNPKLSDEEKNILSSGYKNITNTKRFSWRFLYNQIKKESKNPLAVSYIREIKVKVENEIKFICQDVISLVDEHILPQTEEKEYENRVYYLKLKADYYRYVCEFTEEEEFNKYMEMGDNTYKEAFDIAEKHLPITSITRLGTILNYSVFLFEIKNQREEASAIAKSGLDEGLKVLDDLEKNQQKDTILIIQLLMENLILWNSFKDI